MNIAFVKTGKLEMYRCRSMASNSCSTSFYSHLNYTAGFSLASVVLVRNSSIQLGCLEAICSHLFRKYSSNSREAHSIIPKLNLLCTLTLLTSSTLVVQKHGKRKRYYDGMRMCQEQKYALEMIQKKKITKHPRG